MGKLILLRKQLLNLHNVFRYNKKKIFEMSGELENAPTDLRNLVMNGGSHKKSENMYWLVSG